MAVTTKIPTTLFLIAAIAICATASLPLLSFIGTEDATTTTLISALGSMKQESPPLPTTTMPGDTQHEKDADPLPDTTMSMPGDMQDCENSPTAANPCMDTREDMTFTISGICLIILAAGYYIYRCLQDCCHKYDLGRKLYWAFRDSVCCGCCLRRMKSGKVYEYEEI